MGPAASAVLFDIDGTLPDTAPAIVAAVNEAIPDRGLRPFSIDELRPLFGRPVQAQLEVLRGVTGPEADAFTDRYYDRFMARMESAVVVYPGVRKTLPRLTAARIGTISTRRAKEARRMLEFARLATHFTSIVGGDQVARPKPDPDLPLLAARRLGADPTACVVVGDSPVDVLAGKAGGCGPSRSRTATGIRRRSARRDPMRRATGSSGSRTSWTRRGRRPTEARP